MKHLFFLLFLISSYSSYATIGDFTCLNYENESDKSLCIAAYIFSNHDERLEILKKDLQDFNPNLFNNSLAKAYAMNIGFRIENTEEISHDISKCKNDQEILQDL